MKITQEYLRKVLEYDAETGVFHWLVSKASNVKAGSVAGFPVDGYIGIGIDGRQYYAHRLAWLWVYGIYPASQIDHVNCVKDDNRLSNLRQANNQLNNANKMLQRNNKSGFKGVCWIARDGVWRASIKFNGKAKNLGSFHKIEEAKAAYDAAAQSLFGEFARS